MQSEGVGLPVARCLPVCPVRRGVFTSVLRAPCNEIPPRRVLGGPPGVLTLRVAALSLSTPLRLCVICPERTAI